MLTLYDVFYTLGITGLLKFIFGYPIFAISYKSYEKKHRRIAASQGKTWEQYCEDLEPIVPNQKSD